MSIGEELTRARYKQKLDIRAAEDATKIRVKYLEALENEQFDIIPEPVYVKGFIRAYASFLGLNGSKLCKQYEQILFEKEKAELENGQEQTHINVRGGYTSPTIFEPATNNFPWLAAILTACVLLFIVLGTFGQLLTPKKQPIILTSEMLKEPPKHKISKPHKKPTPKAAPKPKYLDIVLVASKSAWINIKIDGKSDFQGMIDADQTMKFKADDKIEILANHGDRLEVIKNSKTAGFLSSDQGVARKTFTK